MSDAYDYPDADAIPPVKPKAPHALTREQVETVIGKLYSIYTWKHELNYLLNTDADQRETTRRLERERDGWKKQYEACHKLHLEAQEECEKANTFAYKLEIASLQARLTASEAKHKWTTATPKVTGFYWWREDKRMKGWLVDVLADLTIKAITGDGDQIDFLHVIEIGGEWQGPLTPGEE